jgi:methylmalonyl-CoA mutase cobalamin-binding subunit
MMTPSQLDAGWNGEKILVLSPTPTHPQDYGNRKRIYEVCSNLKKRGAQIVFAHYPAEQEWRSRIQISAEAAMRHAWDRYYLVPPTRELHSPPQATHHVIDEWWDPAIGQFLNWIFSIETFDAFVVNYTWLSKALEFAPSQVLRILDTHDRFAGRKELLATNGVSPEYFYTTEEEETVGLRRADIVWAIKDEERRQFERTIEKPVFTMLHLDERPLLPAVEPDAQGYLRVGIIGARNSVNATNIRAFLRIAIPVFEKYFAPIRFMIGGSVCDLLEEVDSRFVTLLGDISDIGQFYRSIDLACVPMSFSTGLKIKVGEAISLGVPVVSVAHAFEGYPARHPFHVLNTFEEIAERLVTISFERTLLQDLRLASVRAREETARNISDNLRNTWQAVQGNRKFILYCVHADALQPKSALRAALESTLHYLTIMSEVIVMVVDGRVDKLTSRNSELGMRARLLVASELTTNGEESPGLADAGFEVINFPEAVSRFKPDIIVADALAVSIADASIADGTLIYRAEMMAQIDSAINQVDASRITGQFRRVIAVGANQSRSLAALGYDLGADVLIAPCMWRSTKLPERLRGGRPRARNSVGVLGADHLNGAEVIIELLRDLGCRPVLVGSTDVAGRRPDLARNVGTSGYLDELFDPATPLPHFVIDGSYGTLGFQFAREILQRLEVPLITIGQRLDQPAITGTPPRGYATTTSGLFEEIVSALACEPGTRSEEASAIESELAGDGGWAYLWNYVTRLRNGQFEEFI